MFKEIQSLDEMVKLREKEAILLGYFSTDSCNVCKVLKPKVAELIENEFPEIKLVYIKSDVFPEIAASFQIFAAPTILIFFEGKEFIRKSRNIGINELHLEISRPYSLLIS